MARDRKPATPRLSMEHLDEVEEQIELLKVAYERYFNGVDRVPPAREHDAVKLRVRKLFGGHTGSTAVRFRAQGLKARLVTYEQYWTRILLQIERGTFKRVLAESKRREYELRRKRAEEPLTGAAERAPSGPAPVADADAPAGPMPRTPSGRAALPDGLDAGEVRALFKQFVAAKKAAGESITGLTYGRMVEKLAREVPKLQERHGEAIRFEVSTDNGKVRLRARRRAARPR
ncbi:MAG: MXAN_5187 C-terminal domain-containing protein [Enhygromyxa sp.]